MFSSTFKWFFPRANVDNNRSISRTSIRFDDGARLSGETHRVNNFEKRLLVWMKKYKSIEEVPAFVAPESVEKARSKMRIRVANWMMALTLVGCMAMVYSGKQARERGETLQQYNLDMHQKFKEEHEAKTKSQ